ncbi:carboxy terminal-processing peptidase [Marinoscillum sp. MHG1-6]|uniref:carboxy terminal-processing peptidase n=1 Tax=Marinoscillum sp. MHG1-6 TaxID=2959627 RepID=UPI002157DF76|nr:carboxy terminal-processing peptidase [Marinoscillum sp. MHG1-6]
MRDVRRYILGIVLFLGLVTSSFAQVDSLQELAPKPEHAIETKVIVGLLNNYHYNKVFIDDSLSNTIFNNYFSSLDPNKSYFLANDVAYFEKYKDDLDDAILDGDVEFGFQVFTLYRERALQRIAHVYTLLENEFDYSEDEYLVADRSKMPWPETTEELNEIWRKIIKNQALSYKLAGKEWDDICTSLTKRYNRIEKALIQYNSEDVYQAYMNAFTSAYDPHTDFFSPIDRDNFKIEMSKSLEGIGARLTQQLDYTVIADVIPGGPAYKSKFLQKDDKIVGVAQGDDGEYEDVIGWRLDDVVQKIRGPKGTVVRLQILKANQEMGTLPDTLRLVRDKIKLEESSAKAEIIPITEGNKVYKLGVITVPSFYIDFDERSKGVPDYKSTTRDVKKLITDLQADGIDGLMIDLRYNGGGSLDEAITLTGLFIPDGPVVQVKNPLEMVDVHEDEDDGVFYDGPLAVLINRYSASASEIFSGAIQDYKRGIVLGENSFGKGTVQNLIGLERSVANELKREVLSKNFSKDEVDELVRMRSEVLSGDLPVGQLKLTLAKFYRVTGSSTQRLGVAPDIAFPSPYDGEEFGEGSRPNALPWDEIKTSRFYSTNKVTDEMIEKLSKIYQKHLSDDKDLIDLLNEVNKIKRMNADNQISLNFDTRKNQDGTDDLATSIDADEVVTEDETEEKLSDDPYLKEGLRLLAELSRKI